MNIETSMLILTMFIILVCTLLIYGCGWFIIETFNSAPEIFPLSLSLFFISIVMIFVIYNSTFLLPSDMDYKFRVAVCLGKEQVEYKRMMQVDYLRNKVFLDNKILEKCR